MSRKTPHDDREVLREIRGMEPIPKKKKRSGFLILSVLLFSVAIFISMGHRGGSNAGTICAIGIVLFLIGMTNKGKNRQFPNPYRDADRWDNSVNENPCDTTGNNDEFAHHHDGDADDGGSD